MGKTYVGYFPNEMCPQITHTAQNRPWNVPGISLQYAVIIQGLIKREETREISRLVVLTGYYIILQINFLTLMIV
jgi:hypothetical protein